MSDTVDEFLAYIESGSGLSFDDWTLQQAQPVAPVPAHVLTEEEEDEELARKVDLWREQQVAEDENHFNFEAYSANGMTKGGQVSYALQVKKNVDPREGIPQPGVIGVEAEIGATYPFKKNIITQDTDKATTYAKNILSLNPLSRTAVFWVDASAYGNGVGRPSVAAITYYSAATSQYEERVTIALEHDGNNTEAELLAMREAVRLAGELDEFEHVKNVIIFSDCQGAFIYLKRGYSNNPRKGLARIRSDIVHRVKKLADDDISVEFNWISERALITPHVAVDKLSKVYRHHIMQHWPAESAECELEPFMIDPARLESAEDLVPFLGRHLYVNGRLAEF